jgi:hypothetical protein
LRFSRRNNPEDTILHSHRRENLKSYKYRLILQKCVPSEEYKDASVNTNVGWK